MDDKKDKKRTEQVVKNEVEALRAIVGRKVSEAHDAYVKTERAARVAASAEVGKVARTYTDPAVAELRTTRDKSKVKAAQIRDAAVATAHGEYQKTVREIDTVHDAGRESVDLMARKQNLPHEQALTKAQARLATERDATMAAAKAEW